MGDARLAEIEAVAAVLRDSAALTEIEVRQGDAVLRVRRAAPARAPFSFGAAVRSGAHEAGASRVKFLSPDQEMPPATKGGAASNALLPPVPAATLAEPAMPVTASLVGVFHALRPPLAPGDRVAEGQVVGQIEAMRLMNDVNAPVTGIVATLYVEDGQPVEYGQALFEIAPAVTPEATSL